MIGKKYKDKNSGGKVQSIIIIKFRSRKSRQQISNARPWIARKKPGRNFTISVDLTRRRYLLLKKPGDPLKKMKHSVFADINYSL